MSECVIAWNVNPLETPKLAQGAGKAPRLALIVVNPYFCQLRTKRPQAQASHPRRPEWLAGAFH
jgi:hypothetical protein